MDMPSMTAMSPTMVMPSGTATAVEASSTASSMNMSMGGDSCKVSMLWNWYTVDACFLSSTWHITSPGMFAGSCIGVICLVMSLEFLRRLTKEYDRYLIYKHAGSHGATKKTSNQPSPSSSIHSTLRDAAGPGSGVFRPTIIEQTIRALLHMLQFAVAYFIMLLAMYFNGYIIICIFIGAFLGAFVFQWEILGQQATCATGTAQAATVCCG